jgi:hypothetical protein
MYYTRHRLYDCSGNYPGLRHRPHISVPGKVRRTERGASLEGAGVDSSR